MHCNDNDFFFTRRHFSTLAMTTQSFELDDLVVVDYVPGIGRCWPAQIMYVHKNDRYTVEVFHPDNPPPYRLGFDARRQRFVLRIGGKHITTWVDARKDMNDKVDRAQNYLDSVEAARASITPPPSVRRGRKQKTPCKMNC